MLQLQLSANAYPYSDMTRGKSSQAVLIGVSAILLHSEPLSQEEWLQINFCGGKETAVIADETSFPSESDGRPFTAERLRDFVPRAAHILQQSETSQFGPTAHLRVAQTALRMGRQVSFPCARHASKYLSFST